MVMMNWKFAKILLIHGSFDLKKHLRNILLFKNSRQIKYAKFYYKEFKERIQF